MVAAHVLDARDAEGHLTWHRWLVEGRASALFAVLAGVILALMSRRTNAAGLAVRALLVALVGLALGELDTGLAVILTYYGLLFLLGLPFLRLRARSLFACAAGWVLAGPVVSQLLRRHLPVRGAASPAFDQLAHPLRLLSELLLTGYYPCLTWLAYLLLGLAIGRCDLRSRSVHTGLVLGALAAAVLTFVVSRALTEQAWVLRRLLPDAGAYGDVSTADAFVDAISGGMHGTTPAGGSWAWLLVVAPHSGTPFDLAHTGGSAALVIGLCLALVARLPAPSARAAALAFGAGTATLSLYSLHVVMRTEPVWPDEVPASFGRHVLVLVALGAVLVAARRRGPLEAVVSTASAAVSRWTTARHDPGCEDPTEASQPGR
jgi:hypothetical protein